MPSTIGLLSGESAVWHNKLEKEADNSVDDYCLAC
jgi:hypothetical protein